MSVDAVSVLERARDDLKARGQAWIAEEAAVDAVLRLITEADNAAKILRNVIMAGQIGPGYKSHYNDLRAAVDGVQGECVRREPVFIHAPGGKVDFLHDGDRRYSVVEGDSANAPEILRTAADAIAERARLRDCPDGERSMARTVAAFNAITGRDLTEVEGWHFMELLKLARATAGGHHLDDHADRAAYAALAGEAAERSASR